MSPIRRLSGLFYNSNNLKQAVGILFVTVLISNILGLVRNVVIANRVGVAFGTIAPLDNYYAAFVLPDLLYSVVIVGALSSAVLPLLAGIDAEGDSKRFWRTFNILLSTGFTAIVTGLIVLYVALPFLVPVIFPGFSPEEQEFTTQLSHILLLSPLFFTVSQLSTSALQAKKYFFAPALAPIVYNVAIISSALLIPDFGLSVLVFGVILGASAHFLVQLPTLLRLGWRFNFEIGFRHEEVTRVIKLMIPRTVALSGAQLLLVAFYYIGSRLQEGSIAIYRLTDDLQTAPVLLLANTLAMAVLPDFARHIAKDNKEQFEELVGKAIRLLLYIFLPVTAFLLIYRWPIISLYIALGRSIDPMETALAVRTFSFFVVSLFFQGAVLLLARAYFARSDTIRPTIYSIVSMLLAFLSAHYLVRVTDLGVSALSLAFSIGSSLNAILLWVNLRLPGRVLTNDSTGRINLPIILLGTTIFSLIVLMAKRVLGTSADLIADSVSVQSLFTIIIGAITGLLFYLIWSRVFCLEQWKLTQSKKNSSER